MKKFVCTVCGYVHEGDAPPAQCPICKAPAEKFTEQTGDLVFADEHRIGVACLDARAQVLHHLIGIEDVAADLVAPRDVVLGTAEDVDPRIIEGLRMNFTGECSEVGMYLAMSRQADREGYPEVAEAFKRYAWEEAEHAAKFAELLGEVLTDSTEKNLKMRVDAEHGACAGKKELATLAKQLNLDAVHDTVHEMCKDEARHGCGFKGLYDRYFGK